MDEKIKNIVEKFLKSWKELDKVSAVIICGSYVTGNPTKHSDIDVQIILKNGTKWRERGNKIIDGILLEYFANPKSEILRSMEKEFLERDRATAHMFFTGEIIMDKFSEAKELKKLSKKYLSKNYKSTNKVKIGSEKYSLWDMQDNLEEVYEKQLGDFRFVYYNYMSNIFSNYCEYIGFPEVPNNKILRFLTDKNDRKKYIIPEFPDKKFIKIFSKMIKLKEEEKMVNEYKKITKHVIGKMGGFSINDFKQRLKIK
ncbi:nucleotidyltransferase domain-containing protein [Candidatus Pacearchaeota archaeon]|nr:nucleotidyltransferase domain-containing protein [Candidatus Pacearchaeota archaeon]